MIFYFSGTGNSLYVARELASAICDNQVISIAQAKNDPDKHYKDETIGIVCPNYGHHLPGIVQRFIEDSNFEAEYLFLIMTYGNEHGGGAHIANEYLKAQGYAFNMVDAIKMVDNFLLVFDIDAQRAIDKHIPQQLDEIKTRLANRENYHQPISEKDLAVIEEFAKEPAPEGALEEALLVNDDLCVGCGVCAKVCPSACFSIAGGKSNRNPLGCELCMGCINLCPSNAFYFVMGEANHEARWLNENVTLADMMTANNQLS